MHKIKEHAKQLCENVYSTAEMAPDKTMKSKQFHK